MSGSLVGVELFSPWPESVQKLPHISPSSASQLVKSNGCKLKPLLSYHANKPESSIPSSGASEIGTVIHKLLDYAHKSSNSNVKPTKKEIHAKFDELILQEEDKIANSKINRHLSPLKGMKDFSKKKYKTCRKAIEIIESDKFSKNSGGNQRVGTRILGSEVLVWDVEKRFEEKQPESGTYSVKGSIDYVHKLDYNSVEIIDYKTGNMIDEYDNIKSEYKVQIQLYATLLKLTAKHSGWDELEIKQGRLENPLNEESHEIKLDTKVNQKLLNDVRDKHNEINRLVSETSTLAELAKSLISPSIENCQFCEFSPGCVGYHEKLAKWMCIDQPEVTDVIGFVVEDSTRMQPNSEFFQLRIRDKNEEIWLIDNIHSGRYPKVAKVKTGTKVAIFRGKTKEIELNEIKYRFQANKRSHAFFIASDN